MRWCALLCLLCMQLLATEPIDVVIPCAKKDLPVLRQCIQSIKKYGKGVRRLIVVSATPLTDEAEWFDEKRYPFSLAGMGEALFPGDPEQAHWFATTCSRRGWIYQQLLKLYAPLVIPGISSQVLVLDADVVFLRPVSFLSREGVGLYTQGGGHHAPYFQAIHRLLPDLQCDTRSGIAHHMLLQRPVIEALFDDIRFESGEEPWRAICQSIDLNHLCGSSFSEYELYFHYLLSSGYPAKVRSLKWKDGGEISKKILKADRKEGFTYVAYHSYRR